jgi:PadR family transcriptional regulator PadR
MMNKSLYVNGVPELLVLRLLSKEEMYGYQLVSEINARSKQALDFGEGCIYPILHRLVAQRHLSSRREIVDGRPRHYYRATAQGKRHAEQLQTEWNRVVTGTCEVLGANHILA